MSSYRTVLTLVESLARDHGPDPGLDRAIAIARDHGAHLDALLIPLYVLPSNPWRAVDLLEPVADAAPLGASTPGTHLAAARLEARCAMKGFRPFVGLPCTGDGRTDLVHQLRTCDLAVLSQPDPGSTGHAARLARVESAILEGGRPVLVEPYADAVHTFGTRVLIAWDGTRESARAVVDALPLLRRAREVRVARFHPPGQPPARETNQRDAQALGAWLDRHGIATSIDEEFAMGPVAEALLSHAADKGSDLIVMGAYGHSPLAERWLGGVTRRMLESMTVPVLMSH
jgi:nucleotide-binding universal stress UspA family protein